MNTAKGNKIRRTNRAQRDIDLFKRHLAGETVEDLAKTFFISQQSVKRIIAEETSLMYQAQEARSEKLLDTSDESKPKEVIREVVKEVIVNYPRHTHYTIVYAEDRQVFSNKVNELIQDEWQCQGGVTRTADWDFTNNRQIWFYSQALVK